MKSKNIILKSSLALFSIASISLAANSVKKDNTKVNERDTSVTSPTAETQSTNAKDVEVVKNIREKVVEDKTLSTYAHNVKIIAEGGRITLKGPVRSTEERTKIGRIASANSGDMLINNELEIVPME